MLDVSVEGYRLEVASGTRRFFVVGPRNFGMRELVAAQEMVACSRLRAYSRFAEAWDDLVGVGGVVG